MIRTRDRYAPNGERLSLPFIGAALGLSGLFATAATGAVIGGVAAAATGGSVLEGAALGGLGGAAIGGLAGAGAISAVGDTAALPAGAVSWGMDSAGNAIALDAAGNTVASTALPAATSAAINSQAAAAGMSPTSFLATAAGKAILGAGVSALAGGLAANQVQNNQINPSQYIVDPVTGQVISSSVVNNQGTTSTGNAQTTALNNTAQAGLSGNLTNFQSQLAPLTNQLSTLYNTEGANKGGYVQSVVNPVKQAGAAAYGTQVQNNALRGITGSSLANESLTNTANTNANNVANATAGALQSSLGLQQGTTNAQAQLASTGYNAGLGTAQAQEGLGTTITNQNLALMGKGQVAQTAGAANANQLSQAQGNAISGVGNALTNALGQNIGLGGTATMPSDVSQIPAGANGYNGASWYSPSTNAYYNAAGSIVG